MNTAITATPATPKCKYTDIMIDIETLDTRPTAVILSIAAWPFDIDGTIADRLFNYKLNKDEQIRHGRTTSADTIKWWNEQSQAAQNETFGGTTPLTNALLDLEEFIRKNCVSQPRIWAKSPQFDLIILKDAYGNKPLPWHYRLERDVRTYLAMCPDTSLLSERPKIHVAMDDAYYQILDVQVAYKIIDK